MPIIQGELGELTPEEAEWREQGVKSVKEQLAEEAPAPTVIIPMVPTTEGERSEPERKR